MSSDAGSEAVIDLVSSEDMLNALRALDRTTATMDGEAGFFVSRRKLSQAKKLFAKFVETAPDQEAANDMAQRLVSLEQNNADARAEIDKRDHALSDMMADLEKSSARLEKEKAAVRDLTGKYGELVRLKEELASTEDELGRAKLASKKTSKGFDPVAMQESLDREELLRKSVKDLQVRRKEGELEVETAKSALAAEQQMKASLELELKRSQNALSKLKSLAASADRDAPIEKMDIQVNVPLVRLLIGDKGLSWLSRVDYNHRINLRDYAHTLLQAANSSNRTKGLADLLALATAWMKQKAFAAREALRPWLMSIEADLKAGRTRLVSWYRDELRRIIGDFKKSSADQKAKYEGRPAVTRAAVAAAHAARKTSSRWVRPLSWWRSAKTACKKVAGAISAGFLYCWRVVAGSPIEYLDVNFDQDEEIASMKRQAAESTGSEPVPPPPPPPSAPKGNIKQRAANLFK